MIDIKAFRIDKGIGQKVLIDLFSCTQGYISALETGRKQPSKEQIRLLEEKFGDLTPYITSNITKKTDAKEVTIPENPLQPLVESQQRTIEELTSIIKNLTKK